MGARTPYRLLTILMLTAMLLTAFSGCAGGGGASADGDEFGLYTSFRDVPGITADEIEAVEALQAAYKSDGEPFKYGMSSTSEVFLDENGAVGGFTGYFCQWLSQLFEIPFEPVILEWTDVHAGFGTGGIDFSGAITRSAEREAAGYIMTDPIVNRQIRYYTLDGYEPAAFEEGRRPRYGFLELSVVNSFVEPYLTEDYEPVFVNNYETAYEMLQNGELDIFYTTTAADAFFSERSDIQDRDFLPVIFQPVSLSTRKAELAPIISVVQKVLQSDRAYQLTEMYRQGQQDFSRMLLFERLTAEERQYIKDHPVIPYAAEVDNYPISFYNQHENKWQGIAEDVLNEASRLTGLTFEKVSDISDVWSTIFHMLESGEASVVSELMRNEEREGRFLWPQTPLLTDHYAFISLMDLREVAINEVTYLRVGIVADSAYADAFRKWFPDHSNTTWFSTINDAMDALDDNEIDLVMASEKQFLALMSYNESSGHKINLMMDFSYESLLGFNINEPLLCSIIEKAMDLIDVEGITDTWTRMDYDYRLQVAQARQPLLLALSGLLLVILVLTAALLYRNSTAEKRLKILVDQRTNELMDQTVTLSTVLNTIPDLIFCKDLDSNFTRINRSMEIFYGVTEEQARGKKDIHAYSIPPEKSEFFRSMDIKTAQERKQLKYEEVTKNAKGEQCIMETLKVPIIKNNVVTGTLGISRDVTERREMEEATKAASQAKTSFLANMSHELRTPLNVIIGLADLMLEDEALPVYLKSNLVSIASSGGTVLSIINDVLDISKIESGKLSIINTEYHVPSLINDTAIMTKTHIGDKPISFSLNIGENLPEVLIGDELRIKQILNNLLSNAVKYTNRGSIILTMQCSNEPDPEDGTVILSLGVKDTGIGISGEDIEPIFTDYFQANAQPGRKADGTGLGLSITRRLAEAMGGTINVESELGKGSNFQVTIKQQYAGEAHIGPDVTNKLRSFMYSDAKRLAAQSILRMDLSSARVLVVDDMRNNLDVAAGHMRRYKLQVDCVTSGQDAIDRVRDGYPLYNAIFMDHMMPGMTGIEAVERIRSIGTDYALKVPIIALTANAVAGVESQFLGHGFQDFLAKPIDIVMLDTILRRWVGPSLPETVGVHDAKHTLPMPKVSIDIPGLNVPAAMAIYNNETDMFINILRSFAHNVPETLDKLRKLTSDNIQDKIKDCALYAHALKGISMNISAESVSNAAATLETAANAGAARQVLALKNALINATDALLQNINAWLRSYDEKVTKPVRNSPDPAVLKRLKQGCENYDIAAIDEAMNALENTEYETGNDLIAWLREKIGVSEFEEVARRLGG